MADTEPVKSGAKPTFLSADQRVELVVHSGADLLDKVLLDVSDLLKGGHAEDVSSVRSGSHQLHLCVLGLLHTCVKFNMLFLKLVFYSFVQLLTASVSFI